MELEKALTAVETRMRVAGLVRRTIDEYSAEARRFAAWFETRHTRPALIADLDVTSADAYIVDFIDTCVGPGRPPAASTTHHRVSQLRAFGGHLATALDLPSNPLAGMSAKAVNRDRFGDALSDDEMTRLVGLLAPSSRFHDLITLALLVIGYECGPRTSEAAQIAVEDVLFADVDGETVGSMVRIAHPAKGGPRRTVPLGVRAGEFIEYLLGHRTSGPLLTGVRRRPLSSDAIQERLYKLSKRAQLGKPLGMQRLRRTAASWQSTYGASSGHLDSVFGWQPNPRDLKSAHYIIPSEAQLLHAHQSLLSPLDRLELRVGDLGLPR